MSHRKQWGHSPSHQTKRELISHRIVCCLNVNWTEGDCYLGLLTRRVAVCAQNFILRFLLRGKKKRFLTGYTAYRSSYHKHNAQTKHTHAVQTHYIQMCAVIPSSLCEACIRVRPSVHHQPGERTFWNDMHSLRCEQIRSEIVNIKVQLRCDTFSIVMANPLCGTNLIFIFFFLFWKEKSVDSDTGQNIHSSHTREIQNEHLHTTTSLGWMVMILAMFSTTITS